jgi:hypothetical protein
MKKIAVVLQLFVPVIFILLTGCGGGSSQNANTTALLSAGNLNLIFVVSPDLANDPLGDIDQDTANLTNQGLQRSLLMATYLKQQMLGTNNVSAIYALEPMTHLQTANSYPDMAAIGFIQQFSLLNQTTVNGITANSFPIGVSYAPGSAPPGVVGPTSPTDGCQGLDFNNPSINVALVASIIQANQKGFHVFSAPWETVSSLLTGINQQNNYNLTLPTTYLGPNIVYVLSITPAGVASLTAFDSKLSPGTSYPVLPAPVASTSIAQQPYFNHTLIGGVNGVVVPAGANTNLTIYLIRHAEAHPTASFEDGNFVGAGQWRALALPYFLSNTLRNQSLPSPDLVYSIDPAQSFSLGSLNISYVRPSLTVLPYAIANNLPYQLVSSFFISMASDPDAAKSTNDYFFTHNAGVDLSGHTVLVAWEHEHYEPLINYLLASYGSNIVLPKGIWPQNDYDTIWTVKFDGAGNVTVNNALSEGIDTSKLPATAPLF